MSPADHAYQARRLIDAVGGTGVAATKCRVGAPQLSRYRHERYGEFMAADVIADLQEAAHTTSYTDAMRGEAPAPLGDLKDDTCVSVEDITAILSAVRQKGQPTSPNLREALHRLVAVCRDDLARLDRDIDAGRAT